MELTRSRAFWHTLFFGFLIIYAAVLVQQLGHGLASLDAHAIVRVTHRLVDQHYLEVSRPPGHPTTEIYLFPAVAWLLRDMVNVGFNDKAYLIMQAGAGLAALCIFYALLCRLRTEPWKGLLASISLGLSAQFFANTVDGEEFVFGTLFLILSFYLVVGEIDPSVRRLRMIAAICCFALATGCRPELILGSFLLPLYALFHPKGGWKQALTILAAEAVTIVLVWLPIICSGLHSPYTAGMNVRESILGGCYRLVFQCFTVPVFVLMCWVLFRSIGEWRRRVIDPFPHNFVFLACCSVPIVFFAALFLHASKPSHVLFGVPFALILAVRRSNGLLIAWTVATIIGCFVTVDIFRQRLLVPPYAAAGTYQRAVQQKPFYKLEYLQQLLQRCGSSPTVIIADLWRWDFEYHIRHGTFAAREQVRDDVPAFLVASAASRLDASPARTIGQPTPASLSRSTAGMGPIPQNNNCVLLPRDAALHPDIIESLVSAGYTVEMDETLYRTLFARYNVTAKPAAQGQIRDVTVDLFPTMTGWR